MLAVKPGRDGQLLVAIVQVLLREVETRQLHHFAANRGACSIGGDYNLGEDRALRAGLFVPQINCPAAKVKACATLIEVNSHPALLRSVHQRNIEIAARDGVDDLGLVFTVRHEREIAANRMHHAAAHRDDDVFDGLPDPGLLQRVNAARGKRKVDRSPSADAHPAHVGTALIQLYRESALYQRYREQRTRQSGADQSDLLAFLCHA